VSELISLGISHKTAPVEVRERVALAEHAAERLLHELAALEEVHEAVVISTCNRTEFYLVTPDPVQAEADLLARLAKRAEIRPTTLAGVVYTPRNCDAARQLYRVASGLESMIIGEAEVQGQVRRAYEAAAREGTSGPLTNRLFNSALRTGGRVRAETAIGAGGASISSVAVDVAGDVLGDLRDRHVVIIGAGETAELTAQALAAKGVTTMFVANRRRDRAIALARRFGGTSGSFDALPGELERADIVIASTASPHTLLGAEEIGEVMAARRGRPLLLIDLAVPRDIDAQCAELAGVTVLDMDALQQTVSRHMQVRQAEARRAEGIVEEEIQSFAGWLGQLEVLPTLAALRARGDEVVDRLLAENAGRWEDLTDADRERVETIARTVVKRLLHEPTARVKGLEAEQRHARLQLLRELFGLEEPTAEADAAPAEVRSLRSH
jgi:glutamyl-tRNA reductase